MREVTDQLASFQEHLDSQYPPVTALEAQARAERTELVPYQRKGRGRRWTARVPGWAVALAAAVVVAVTLGLVAVLASNSTDQPVVEQPPPTAVSPAPERTSPTTEEAPADVVPVTEGSLIATQWISYRLEDNPQRLTVAWSVAAVGPERFVIAGQTWSPENNWHLARLWKSADGVSWAAVPDDGTLFWERTRAAGIIAGERGMVAWGYEFPQRTVIWFSPDGTDWTVAMESDEPYPPHGLVLESGEYVLYGTEWFGSSNPRVLFSADGITWETIPTPVAFSAMVQLDSGQLVATGGKASEPMTWASSDGRVWTRLSDDHSTNQGQGVLVTTMAATEPGLVAGGMDSDGEPTFWVSADGRTFQETASFPLAGPAPEDALREQPPVQAIAVGQGWMVAVGNYGYFAGDGAVWVSQNGFDWEPVPVRGIDNSSSGLVDVTNDGSTFVAVGWRGDQPLVLRWEPGS